MEYLIRPIKPEDNDAMAGIIREVMTEFGADPRTTVLGDPSIFTLYQNYQEPRAAFNVAELNGKVVGGAGVRQLEGTPEAVCELQRMFLLPEARGKGLGKKLIHLCIQQATQFGYTYMYLESLGQMTSAIALYVKTGFGKIDEPLGHTGHGGCNVFMSLRLGK